MKPSVPVLGGAFAMLAAAVSSHAASATTADRAFVAKVSQGGMFEVEAGKLAEQKASAQDVKDFAVMEVHDHTLVGDKLKALSSNAGIPIDTKLNAEFSAKLEALRARSGAAFDSQYMMDMGDLHPQDGAAFLRESSDGGSPAFRTFGTKAVLLSAEATRKLTKKAAAVQWVMDAFGHLKAIGFNAEAKPLLDKAGVEPDEGVVDLAAFVRAAKKRYWDREANVRTLA